MQRTITSGLVCLIISTFCCATTYAQSELTFEQTAVQGDLLPGDAERSFAIAEDSQGGIFIAGQTGIALVAPPEFQEFEAYLARYVKDDNGVLTLDWVSRFGFEDNLINKACSIAIDPDDNVFVAYTSVPGGMIFDGGSADVLLRKYAAGSDTHSWEVDRGPAQSDSGIGVATDQLGNVYLTGTEGGGFFNGPSDGFLECYRDGPEPTLAWKTIIENEDTNVSSDVAVDAENNIYIVGHSAETFGGLGDPADGDFDVFVAKFEDLGNSSNRLWFEQIGTPQFDFGNAITTGLNPGDEIVVYIGGTSFGGLGGKSSFGASDAFVAKFNSDGTLLWDEQFGSPQEDEGNDVAVDDSGNVYLTGSTMGNMAVSYDKFLVNYRDNGSEAVFQDAVQMHNVPNFPDSHIFEFDQGTGVSARTPGTVYTTGFSQGKFPETFPGNGPILELAWIVEHSVPIPGDVNCDGVVDLLDVAPFVDMLLNGGYSPKADINGDGSVDLLDVAPFVDLLL